MYIGALHDFIFVKKLNVTLKLDEKMRILLKLSRKKNEEDSEIFYINVEMFMKHLNCVPENFPRDTDFFRNDLVPFVNNVNIGRNHTFLQLYFKTLFPKKIDMDYVGKEKVKILVNLHRGIEETIYLFW